MFNLQGLLDFLRSQSWQSKIAMVLVGGVIIALAVIGAVGSWADFEGFFKDDCICEPISAEQVSAILASCGNTIAGDGNVMQLGENIAYTQLKDFCVNVVLGTPVATSTSAISAISTPTPTRTRQHLQPTSTPTLTRPSLPTVTPTFTVTITPSLTPASSILSQPEEFIRAILEPLTNAINDGSLVLSSQSMVLPHNETRIEPHSADVNLRNFATDVSFKVPYSFSDRCWDFGLIFRDAGINDQMRLVVECGGYWKLINQEGMATTITASGQTELIRNTAGDINNIRLIIQDNAGYLFINEHLIADLDVSEQIRSGDIKIATGFNERNRVVGQATIVEGFSVWSLPERDEFQAPDHSIGKLVFVILSDIGNEDIYTMNENGTNQEPLVVGPERARYPIWSPDGTMIAYVSNETGNDDIFLISSSGENKIQITTNTATDTSPEWSPDGKSLAFLADTNGIWHIAIFNLESQEMQLFALDSDIFSGSLDAVGGLAWSPTIDELAFWSGNDKQAQIYILDLQSLDIRVLAEHTSRNFMPTWSHDGSKLAFVSDRDGYHNIFISDRNGQNLQRITNDTYSDLRPVWSNDSQRIYFHSTKRQAGSSWQIFVMNSDGSNIQSITDGSLGIEGEFFANWSPYRVVTPTDGE